MDRKHRLVQICQLFKVRFESALQLGKSDEILDDGDLAKAPAALKGSRLTTVESAPAGGEDEIELMPLGMTEAQITEYYSTYAAELPRILRDSNGKIK